MEMLHGYVYIDQNHQLFVNPKNRTLYIGQDRRDGVDLNSGKPVEDIVEEVIQFMFQKNPSGYRFALNKRLSRVNLNAIVNSDIIKTDLERLNNIGSSFAVSKLIG